MEARLLLRMDESRYHRLRMEAARETPLSCTGELVREQAVFAEGGDALPTHAARGTRVWGTFDDFHLAGVVALSPLYADTEHQTLWLWGLYVQPRFRGTPASRCLMRAALAWADTQHPGGNVLAAYHHENRRARQLLERFGFIESDTSQTLTRAGLAGAEDRVMEYSSRALPPRRTTP